MLDDKARAGAGRAHLQREEAALHQMKPVHARIFAWRAGSMRVAGRAAAELLDAGIGIDGIVLPMAVAAQHEGLVANVVAKPSAELAAFGSVGGVAVIVALVRAVRTHNGRRTHNQLPIRLTRHQRIEQPLLLRIAPDRFLRPVRSWIRSAEVAPLE